jgi:hypothetical protein
MLSKNHRGYIKMRDRGQSINIFLSGYGTFDSLSYYNVYRRNNPEQYKKNVIWRHENHKRI